MVLKRHEDKPWEWKDNECFLKAAKQSDCDGVMELKDVTIKGGTPTTSTTWGLPAILEKIWVCNKCGCVFVE